VKSVSPNVFMVEDTCNVYLLRSDDEAVLIDFGSGDILDRLGDIGVGRVTDVLVTHHHRDQVQGLARAAAAGIRIWVPPAERDLIEHVDVHWQARPIDNDYDLRQDRFSLLEAVPVAGAVGEYQRRRYGQWDILALPTPGHTVGSVSYIVDADGRRLAFTGDLLMAPGKIWSLAATQWTYNGVEGVASTIVSCHEVLDTRPELLLPSHGAPIDDPQRVVAALEPRLQDLVNLRRSDPWNVADWRVHAYETLSPHLLRNRTSVATSYALLSQSGAALLIDFGYDMTTGLPSGSDRSSRRPWLASLGSLRRDHGVDRVEVVVPTHYHDDHVAGFNLLRDVEGTSVWVAASVSPILEDPWRYDLPCLWYDPIKVDRSIPLGQPVRWREYELTMYELPGHTLYAVAIAFEVDGQVVVATGDQQDGGWVAGARPEFLNYQYKNRFRVDDFVKSAELYRRLKPDLLISGHWAPRPVTSTYLDHLLVQGEHLAKLHRELLPLDTVDFGAEGFGARIEPYRSQVRAGETATLTATICNPFSHESEAVVAAVVPTGWAGSPEVSRVVLSANGNANVTIAVEIPSGESCRRARVAVDLCVGGVRFGQQAEALIDVV
jgi:glyoxylase-like metal-dependent hydrolase (beta-lactamase superfamily II)